MTVSLHHIETAWLNESPRAISHVVRSHSTEVFYAAAFWLFYCDYSQILTPALAANSESFVTTHEEDGESWSTRWIPAEWHWPVLDRACDAMKAAYIQISEAMANASQAEWRELIDAHDQMIARVARKLTSQAQRNRGEFRNLTVPNGFVVAAIDDQRDAEDYNALIRASVDPNRLAQIEGLIRK